MNVLQTNLKGVLLIEPRKFKDERGFFLESFHKKRYEEFGISEDFVQDNHSRSYKNIIRGLHFTSKKPQSQILSVIRGRIFDVVVDIRKSSSTFGQWHGNILDDSDGPSQIYMSAGFAHGFCVLSEIVDLHYKVSQIYDPKDDRGILWNDRDLDIKWPIDRPIVSTKDLSNINFSDLE